MKDNKNFFEDALFHLDSNDKKLNKKHYGYYVVTKKDKDSSVNRLYFSQMHKIEYYKSNTKNKDNKISKNVLNETSYILINESSDEKYIFFIIQLIQRIFVNQVYSRAKSRNILRGIKLILTTLQKLNINKEYIYILNHQLQVKIVKENSQEHIGRLILDVFLCLSEVCDSFSKSEKLGRHLVGRKRTSTKTIKNSLMLEISPSVLYQLKLRSIEELDYMFKRFKEHQKWIREFNYILSQKNILKTLLGLSINKKLLINTLYILLNKRNKNIFDDYMKKRKLGSKNKKNKLIFESFKEKLTCEFNNAEVLKEDIKTFSLLMFVTGCNLQTNKLKKQFHYGQIKTSYRFRGNLYASFGIKRKEYIEYSVVDNLFMYPLVLLTLIETGRNLEVLCSWEVRKEDNKFVLGVDRGLFIDIEGYKNKSNSGGYDTAISKESKLWKYLSMFLEINNSIYSKCKTNKFFQYYSTTKNVKNTSLIQEVGRSFFTNVKTTTNNFFDRYQIVDSLDNRINWIDHTLIRKAHNYQKILQGKTLYERQISKNHKSSDTTEENYSTYDSRIDKQIKLGGILEDLFEKIFNGQILREENSNGINGLLSDCIDNENPTYIGQKLKSNHYCLDWKKCLTMCDKCIVIPKIHGPAIFAWRDYLLELKENVFIDQQYFEKENYHFDLQAAEETLYEFTDEEYEYSNKESYKYKNIVRMEIPTSVKKEKELDGMAN